jgi:hypothetical protein
MNGGLLALAVATLLFIGASLSLGLVLSTIAKSQLQAMQLTIFILLPSILLSGFMFPFEGMPRLAQHIAEVLPAPHFMRAIRAVILRDASSAPAADSSSPIRRCTSACSSAASASRSWTPAPLAAPTTSWSVRVGGWLRGCCWIEAPVAQAWRIM